MIQRLLVFSAAVAFFSVSLLGTAHAVGAPELDPGSAASGLALLIGGALLLVERYRR